MIQITERKFYPSLMDGSGFSDLSLNSSYLRACVGDRVKAVYKYRLTVTSSIVDGTTENFDFTIAGQCTRALGSFITDGFAIGDTFKYFNAVPTEIFAGTITGITNNVIQFTVTSGAQPSTVINTNNVAFRYNGVINGIAYSFGLPFSLEADTYSNRVNGLGQLYIGNLGGPTLDVLQDAIPTNYNFETGGLKAMSITTGDPFVQEFQIEHIFVVLPYFLNEAGYLDALSNHTIPVEFQTGALRYINNIYFCTFPGQINSNKNLIDNLGGGAGKWFNQNPNVLSPSYSITSIAYSTGAGIDPNVTTSVTLVVHSTGTNINNDTRIYLYHAIAKTPTFNDATETYNERVAFDYFAGKLNDTGDGPNGIIKNVLKTAMGASDFTITFDIDPIDLSLLAVGDKFIMGIGVGDEDLTIDTSDMLMLYDYQEYLNLTDDIAGMVEFDGIKIYDYDKKIDNAPFTGVNDFVKVWNQDEILLDFGFTINKPILADIDWPTLEKVTFHLEARKSDGTYFIIEGSQFDFPIVVTRSMVAGYPVDNVHVSDQRNFNQLDGSNLRIVRLWSGVGTADDNTHYAGLIGFKVNWQKWLQNITSDAIFYDPAEPFNNLNQRTSNYSELNDYRIRAAISVSVSNEVRSKASVVLTQYRIVTIPFIVRDYDDDGANHDWNTILPSVKTYTQDGITDLLGNLLYNDYTLMRIVWKRASATALLANQMNAIHRIEPAGSPTCDYIEFFGSDGDNLESELGPVSGSTNLKITKISTTEIHTECLIDGRLLTQGITYNLTGRLWCD